MQDTMVGQAPKDSEATTEQGTLAWADNAGLHKLLDVLAAIMADEYIQVAKENPHMFTGSGPDTGSPPPISSPMKGED